MEEGVNQAEDFAWEVLAMKCWGDDVAMMALGIVREMYFERWQTIGKLETKLRESTPVPRREEK